MPATSLGNNHITDIYMSALSSLSKEDKIILATKLLNSAAQTDKKNPSWTYVLVLKATGLKVKRQRKLPTN